MKFYRGTSLIMLEPDSFLHPDFWQRKWQQFARTIVCRSSDGDLLLSVWDGAKWQGMVSDVCLDVGLFGQVILQIAAQDTLFRKCSFPSNLVAKDNIDEAIQLDLIRWSPWGDEVGVYYSSIRNGDNWDVSVWIWEREAEQQMQKKLLASGYTVTHIVPEDVWMASAMARLGHTSLIIYQASNAYRYLLVNQDGAPVALAWVRNDHNAKMFVRGLGIVAENIDMIVYHDEVNAADLAWIPELAVEPRALCRPSGQLVNRGGLPGILGWHDPAAWKPLLAGVFALALIWMMGSYGVVWAKKQAVDESLMQAKAGGEEVLHARKTVGTLTLKLAALDALEAQQARPVLLLNALSHYLPKDVWLQSLYFRSGNLEIKGQGLHVTTLAGKLEKMPQVTRATYIGDIRNAPNSKQQLFGMSLYLKVIRN